VPQELLLERGYQVLGRSDAAGAYLFIKHRNSLFVFFQGHPEYARDSLLREYRRDAGRFLAGERNDFPEIPSGYFDLDAIASLTEFREHALSNRNADLIARFPTASVEAKHSYTRREQAVRIYSNWIEYLAKTKYRAANHDRGVRHRQA
jgi:homoserine O-succinyltransferase